MSGGNQYRAGHPEPVACAIDWCPKVARARGWCAMHYARWNRHGDPLWEPVRRVPLPPSELARLRAMVGVPRTGPTKVQARRWKRFEEAG